MQLNIASVTSFLLYKPFQLEQPLLSTVPLAPVKPIAMPLTANAITSRLAWMTQSGRSISAEATVSSGSKWFMPTFSTSSNGVILTCYVATTTANTFIPTRSLDLRTPVLSVRMALANILPLTTLAFGILWFPLTSVVLRDGALEVHRSVMPMT